MKISHILHNTKEPFFSLEFFPPKEKAQWPDFFSCVEQLSALKPAFSSVTYGAGGSSQENTLEIARRIFEMGLEPMVHLTCVGAKAAQIKTFLGKVQDIGIENVLALRGDPPKNMSPKDVKEFTSGEFRVAEDLVRYIRRVAPEMSVGVAGYPAPHPESPTFALDRTYTLSKIRAGAEFVVTQVFFDVREYFDFVDALRQKNVNVPVVPGILPIQSLSSVRTILSLCGANMPSKLFMELERAHKEGGDAAVHELGIAFTVEQIRKLLEGGAPGIHLYTLNKAELCLRIAEQVKTHMA